MEANHEAQVNDIKTKLAAAESDLAQLKKQQETAEEDRKKQAAAEKKCKELEEVKYVSQY